MALMMMLFFSLIMIFSSGDDLYLIYLKVKLFKEEGNDTNQVRSEFHLKMPNDKFCKIMHIS
jgi:hypothetical protein